VGNDGILKIFYRESMMPCDSIQVRERDERDERDEREMREREG